MADLHEVIAHYMKGVCYNLTGDTLDGLEILDGSPKPTKKQVQKWCIDYENKTIEEAYKNKRAREYPSIGDQLDMLWRSMDSKEIPVCKEFYQSIKSVEDKYPKGK